MHRTESTSHKLKAVACYSGLGNHNIEIMARIINYNCCFLLDVINHSYGLAKCLDKINDQNTFNIFQENTFGNVVCENAAILFISFIY